MIIVGSGVGFRPSDIAGLDWWLNADTISGNDGDPVIQWQDSSGAGIHFGQGTSSRRPILKVNLYNGHKAVRFVSDDSLVPDPSPRTLAAANTLICVCSPSSTVPAYILKGSGGQGGPAFISKFNPGSGAKDFEYFFTTTALHERATFAASTSGLHILTLHKTDGSGNYVGLLDAVQIFANAIHASDNWDPQTINGIGLNQDGTRTYDGDICEVLHWPSVLSGPNLTLVHDYLKAKYGI